MKKNIFALFATAALCVMAAGCSDDDSNSNCPATCTEGCEADGTTCKKASFDDVYAKYCQTTLACLDHKGLLTYLDRDGNVKSLSYRKV